jgi:hypothetical protein
MELKEVQNCQIALRYLHSRKDGNFREFTMAVTLSQYIGPRHSNVAVSAPLDSVDVAKIQTAKLCIIYKAPKTHGEKFSGVDTSKSLIDCPFMLFSMD